MAFPGNPAADRLSWLQGELDRAGSIRIVEAAVALDVSEMTIRRDLLELESLGVARRVRGGAVVLGGATARDRQPHNARAERRIVAKLLPLVPDTGVVAFDASPTVRRLAGALEGARDLLVLTNGVETFTALQGKPGIKPVLTGGEDPDGSGTLVGPVALRVSAAFHSSHLFCSADGVHPASGSSVPVLEQAEVIRQLAAASARTVLAVAAGALGTREAMVALAWDDVDVLVTELDPGAAALVDYVALAAVL